MKLLAVYNICGIGGFQNFIYYQDALRSLLCQQWDKSNEIKIVVSSCCSNDDTVRNLKNQYGGFVSFNWIGESLPLTVTFNHTVMKSVEAFGEFDGYLYLDSGINFWDPSLKFDALKTLADTYQEHKPAILAAMPSNDDGSSWWGIQYPDHSEYTYKIGETTNLHCQIYSNEFRKAYNGKLHCDIFANDTSESVTSYLCAAIGKPFMMTNRIQVFHNAHLDGASIGWRGREGYHPRLFVTTKTMDERYLEGREFGFGYEECNGNQLWLHDPALFEDGKALREKELLEFLKKELFLSKEEFNYDGINHHFEV